MRIIAGNLRGRRINPPANLPVRPTTDMAREALFNILNNYIDFEEVSVLDLFAGTGAISFEFISRGVVSTTAVDINAMCIDHIRATATRFSVGNLYCVRANVFEMMKRVNRKFDIVFADPPYELEGLDTLPNLVMESGCLNDEGIFILEHPRDYNFEQHPSFWQHRHYGKVNFTFFVNNKEQ